MKIAPSLKLLFGLISLLAIVGDVPAAQIVTAQNFAIVSRLTGANSINQTASVDIGGTDLGHSVNHNGKTYFLFGDTFSGELPDDGGNWRNNVMAWSTDHTPANGITFDGWVNTSAVTGNAQQVIRSGSTNQITEIPTGAISVNNRIYAWYMAVNNWGPPGEWSLSRAGLASWKEGDATFSNVTNFSFAGDSNFGMVAAQLRSPLENTTDRNIYLWGTPSGRFGGVKLARVLPENIETLSAYQYFNGSVGGVPQWTSSEGVADFVVPDPVGEMSVMYNPAAGAWTMMYFNEVNDSFELRQSQTPWGQWSDPIQIATSTQAPGGLYAPYMNPLFIENGGRTVYFTMSLWNPYDVYLARVDLVIVPEPLGIAFVAAGAAMLHRRRRPSQLWQNRI